MVCKVYFTKILFPQESKVSTVFLKLKSGPEDGDQGHGLLLQHQGPKRVCPEPFPAKVSKVGTFFPRPKTGPEDGDQGNGLLLQHQGPKRACPVSFLIFPKKYIKLKKRVKLNLYVSELTVKPIISKEDYKREYTRKKIKK